jgi:amino acid transporter
MERWTLNDFYIMLSIYGLASFVALILCLFSDVRKRREAQGKKGWFDRPTFTKYTWRKLGATFVALIGFGIIILGGVIGESYVCLFPGLIAICIGLGTREAIHDDELFEKDPWLYWMRRR